MMHTVLLTYYKDDLMGDDVIDYALLGICSNENIQKIYSVSW